MGDWVEGHYQGLRHPLRRQTRAFGDVLGEASGTQQIGQLIGQNLDIRWFIRLRLNALENGFIGQMNPS